MPTQQPTLPAASVVMKDSGLVCCMAVNMVNIVCLTDKAWVSVIFVDKENIFVIMLYGGLTATKLCTILLLLPIQAMHSAF